MTAQRQERYRWRPGLAFIALLAGVGAPAALDWAAQAATTERLVVNRYSGLAIEGYDPVAYFTDERAMRGLPDLRRHRQVRSGVSAMRATGLPLWLIPKSTARNLADTTRSIWRGASPAAEIPGSGP